MNKDKILIAEAYGDHDDPSFDNFYEYQVFRLKEDQRFLCFDHSDGRKKILESEKQIVDFFGYNNVAKNIYKQLGIDCSIEISSIQDGAGEEYELNGYQSINHKFVGKRIHRSLKCDSDEIIEIYKLNIDGYIYAVKGQYGYTYVELIDEQQLTAMLDK